MWGIRERGLGTGIFDREMENVGIRGERLFGTSTFEQEMMQSEAEKREKVFETRVCDKDVMENVEDKREEAFGGDALFDNVVPQQVSYFRVRFLWWHYQILNQNPYQTLLIHRLDMGVLPLA
ncbi:hypothetical protein AMTR_s00010p00256420 [Amborella trichopoda]|uniref:Uncharacterized protein n=1 Tax=Amborella trichopoda TaxID=13333 RepID=W1NG00_AMBTC|nr:hypothetical protein AMTR_s00010p00256420 [Amborella trichopoda]